MSFCLIKSEVDKFRAALRDGTIDPEKLVDMSSAERRAFFADIVGDDNAREVNTLLESKLLLKDQERGMIAWAKQVAGISEDVRNDMISRIGRMGKVLDPTDEQSFLADLAAKKLGTEITMDEALAIADLSRKVSEARDAIPKSDPVGSPARLTYGAHYVALQNLVHDLKNSNDKTTIGEAARRPLLTAWRATKAIPGLAKSIKASLDVSFIGRQGFRAIFTNPALWARNSVRSLGYFAKSLGKPGVDDSIMNGLKADVFSRPNALNGRYKGSKLDVGITTEEAYPTSLPARIPGLGRAFKASETAYNGMAMMLRADIADKVLAAAENSGADLTDPQVLRSIGKLVNSLTGRGDLGQFEKVGAAVNVVFFSPKSLKASFDVLTAHALDRSMDNAFVRKEAAKNLLKVVAGIAMILGIAAALWPRSVEPDERSADFGKIKIGDTRIDVTGGMASLVVLAARLLTMSSKSSTTGKINPLNSGKYGAQTGLDVAVQFATNKTSPVGSVLVDILRGQTFGGGKVTVGGELVSMFEPFPVSTIRQTMSDPRAANPLLAEMADAFGFAVNTYH